MTTGQLWTECSLGDLVTLKRGYDLPHRNRTHGPYPIVSSSGVTGFHKAAKAKGPGVVTGRYGTLGEVFFVRGDFWPLNTSLYVQNFKGNDPLYVSYLLRTLNFGHRSGASAVPGVNRNALHLLPVSKPEVGLQRKIASILSAYDDLIENNLRRIRILEDMAQLIYREWFVKFRFPGHEGVKMVESALGMIPEGWEPSRVASVATVQRGRSYRGNELAESGGMPFVNLKCVDRNGGFRSSGLKRFVGEYKAAHLVRRDDIVMAVTDMTQERRIVARAARIPDFGENEAVISMDLVKIQAAPEINAQFLYGLFRFSSFPDEVKQYANGANVLHLHPDRIGEFPFPLPPAQLRDGYGDTASRHYALCDNLQKKNTLLRQTRDLLLPSLISGQLDVSQLDIDVGEAAA